MTGLCVLVHAARVQTAGSAAGAPPTLKNVDLDAVLVEAWMEDPHLWQALRERVKAPGVVAKVFGRATARFRKHRAKHPVEKPPTENTGQGGGGGGGGGG